MEKELVNTRKRVEEAIESIKNISEQDIQTIRGWTKYNRQLEGAFENYFELVGNLESAELELDEALENIEELEEALGEFLGEE